MTKLIRKAKYGMLWTPSDSEDDILDSSDVDITSFDDIFSFTNLSSLFKKPDNQSSEFDSDKIKQNDKNNSSNNETLINNSDLLKDVKLDKSQKAINRGVYVARYLMAKGGLTDYQAAACAGVFVDENGCDPSTYMKAEKSNKGSSYTRNGGYGAGIGSWTGTATKSKVLASVGYSPTTKIEDLPMDTQCEMVVREMNGNMKKYYDALKRTNNMVDASATAILITAGVGYAKGKWDTHPDWSDAENVAKIYADSNNRRYGYNKDRINSSKKRLGYAKKILEELRAGNKGSSK